MKSTYEDSSRIEELNREITRLKQKLSKVYGSQQAPVDESEEQYRFIVESANSIIMRLDTKGTLKFVNEFTLRFFGYTREEMIGKNVMMIIPPTESTGRDLTTLIPDILENADKYPKNENENIRKNGERVWVSWTNSIINDANGNPVEILTIGSDISGRRQVEKKLEYERELFEGIVDNIPVMITIYDPKQNKFRFNKALKDTVGWTEEDALDGNIFTKVYPDPGYRQSVIDYIQSLEPGWKEWVITTKNGSHVDSSWSNINLLSGVQIGIGIDTRERKKSPA
jgi:PAS domain S-box-containing protein